MLVTLIIIGLSDNPLRNADRIEMHTPVPTIAECQAWIVPQLEKLLAERPDLRSISATCLVSPGRDL